MSSMTALPGTDRRSSRLVGCAMPSEENEPTSLPSIVTLKGVTDDAGLQVIPGSGLQRVRNIFRLGFQHGLVFGRQLFRFLEIVNGHGHVPSFQIGKLHRAGVDFRHAKMPGMDFLEFQIGKIQTETVLGIFEHETELDHPVLEFSRMGEV